MQISVTRNHKGKTLFYARNLRWISEDWTQVPSADVTWHFIIPPSLPMKEKKNPLSFPEEETTRSCTLCAFPQRPV